MTSPVLYSFYVNEMKGGWYHDGTLKGFTLNVDYGMDIEICGSWDPEPENLAQAAFENKKGFVISFMGTYDRAKGCYFIDPSNDQFTISE